MLRKSHGNSTKSKEIENPRHWKLEKASNRTGNRVPQSSHDHRRRFRHNYSKIHSRQLDRYRGECPLAGAERLSQVPMSVSSYTLCSTMPPRENMVSSTNFATTQTTHAITHNRMFLVHMARCNFQGPHVHSTTSKGPRWLGHDKYRRQTQKAPLHQNLVIVCT